jgi:hypothetical protein
MRKLDYHLKGVKGRKEERLTTPGRKSALTRLKLGATLR